VPARRQVDRRASDAQTADTVVVDRGDAVDPAR